MSLQRASAMPLLRNALPGFTLGALAPLQLSASRRNATTDAAHSPPVQASAAQPRSTTTSSRSPTVPHPKSRPAHTQTSRSQQAATNQHKSKSQYHASTTQHQHAAMQRQQQPAPSASEAYNPPTHLSRPPPTEETPLTETVRDFLNPAEFYGALKQRGLDFYTGVPDSLLKDFCGYVQDHTEPSKHVITANEGSAIGLATGYHLATRRYPVVYMQNSGFGNAVNPLLSLADPKVYSVPMLLMIGWRGEPGKKDEPQHLVQGKVMSSMLADMNIQFEVLPDFIEGAEESIASALHHMERRNAPYALLVRRQTFTPYKLQNKAPNEYTMTREEAIQNIIPKLSQWDITVATTGFASRELYEYRQNASSAAERATSHKRDFLTVGSMGHASIIGLGIAMNKPSRQTIVLDGDGAAIMHMGNFATIGQSNASNFKHVLLNNGAHDSVGGQPTPGFQLKFPDIARASGYKWVKTVSTVEELQQGVNELRHAEGPALLEVLINKGARKNLGRPKSTPLQNKIDFMGFLDT